MTKHNENMPHDPSEWDELIGSVYLLESLPDDVQKTPGLVVLGLEDGAVCPESQFLPAAEEVTVAPALAEAWEFARARSANNDQSGLDTFLVFVTKQAELEGHSFWDVLVSEQGAKELEAIKPRIVAALPKYD